MTPPFRYVLHLAFDGTRYHGWQKQPNALTVQQVLSDALSLLVKEPVILTGCGRTDAGVHAEVFYAHTDIRQDLSPDALQQLCYRLNRFIDNDIAIFRIFSVPPSFHARFSASSRTYRYRISRIKNPFQAAYTYHFRAPLNVTVMNEGAEYLLSVQDFTSFAKAHSDTTTNICHLVHARWEERGGELVLQVTADRFLRNMVRAITGTLISLGMNQLSLEELKRIVESRNRSEAGESVPAHGLSLIRVTYPEIT